MHYEGRKDRQRMTKHAYIDKRSSIVHPQKYGHATFHNETAGYGCRTEIKRIVQNKEKVPNIGLNLTIAVS